MIQSREDGSIKTDVNAPVRCVIFDFGGVISYWQAPEFHTELASRVGVDAGELERAYFERRLDYDRGRLSGPEYWTRVLENSGAGGVDLDLDEIIESDIQSWTRINPEVIDLMDRLRRAGMPLALLSNLPHDHLSYFSARFAWLEMFSVRVFSCELGTVKPEPEIYRTCLERIGKPAGSCLFVDDTRRNVEGARRAGLQALLFSGVPHLERELRARLGSGVL